jgi:hypothetical protein
LQQTFWTCSAEIEQKVGSRTQQGQVIATGNASIPAIRIEEGIKEYADASTNTDPPIREEQNEAGPSTLTLPENPPAYTPKAESISAQEVLEHAHPRNGAVANTEDVEDEYRGLVEGLGLRCNVIEEEIRSRKEERSKLSLSESSMHVGRYRLI